MQHLDVCKRESGKLWHRKPSPAEDGHMLSICHSVSTPLALHSRNVRFLRAAFDASGDRFIAGDYQGNIFSFDIHRNRFSLVQKTGSACTALAFALRRRTEFLAAMSDYSLKCFDTDTKELVAWMKGHESAIHTISLHTSGRYALTSSSDTGQLWDLDTFQRKRKLNVKENVGILKVFFLPMSNTIMTCFKDDTIFAWESDTLACKYQLHVPEGKPPGFKAFAATRDSRYLVAGGRSRYLHVWALDTHKLHHVIELPKKVTCVRQLEFLPDSFDGGSNQVLGVLCQDGIMRFVNINSCKQLFDIGRLDDRISFAAVSPAGRHIVTVMETGNVNLYCVSTLSAEINQPPAPLLKVLKSNKMSETDGDISHNKSRQPTGRRGKAKAGQPQDGAVAMETDHTPMELPEGLNMEKLYAILKGYGEYPAKYRMFIWRSLLKLPENHAAYGALVDKGTHPSCARLHETYPIKSQKLLRVLQRVMSSLAHWSPIFGETDYLPLLSFPFVKLFQNNQLVCFEVIASILTNWCQHWFEYFPNPPINMLAVIENVLAYHDRHLLAHFVEHGITSQIYAWPLLETLFSEVMTREEWLKLFDNVFSNHPSFLFMVAVAYCIANRGPLLKCTEREDFKYFFHHRNAVDVSVVVKEAYRLMEGTPEDIHPEKVLENFEPLTRGQYPVFNKYPKFIVDYQVQERERIREEEAEYLRQRELSLDLQKDVQKKRAEEEAWYRQQELLLAAEDKRRKLMAEEEQKLRDQRARLNAMTRELKLKELQLMDATRNKFLAFQQQQKEAELVRLDDEIRRKAELREVETQATMEETEIKNMELQLQRKLFEQELFRKHMEDEQKQTGEFEARRRREELEERITDNIRQVEREKERQTNQAAFQDLARAEVVGSQTEHINRMEHLHQMDELDRERSAFVRAEAQEENRQLQERIQRLINRTEEAQLKENDLRSEEFLEQERVARDAESRRLGLLEREVDRTREHVRHLERSQDLTDDRLEGLREGMQNLDARDRNGRIINDSVSEGSVQFSLDRGRADFERQELNLMEDVRRLRQKLAQDNRQKRPPAAYSAE